MAEFKIKPSEEVLEISFKNEKYKCKKAYLLNESNAVIAILKVSENEVLMELTNNNKIELINE